MFTTGAWGGAAGPGFAFLELQNFLIGLGKKLVYYNAETKPNLPTGGQRWTGKR